MSFLLASLLLSGVNRQGRSSRRSTLPTIFMSSACRHELYIPLQHVVVPAECALYVLDVEDGCKLWEVDVRDAIRATPKEEPTSGLVWTTNHSNNVAIMDCRSCSWCELHIGHASSTPAVFDPGPHCLDRTQHYSCPHVLFPKAYRSTEARDSLLLDTIVHCRMFLETRNPSHCTIIDSVNVAAFAGCMVAVTFCMYFL